MFENAINGLLGSMGMGEENIGIGRRVVVIVAIALLAWLADLLCRRALIPAIKAVVQKTKATWDDYLLNDRVLDNLCHIIPSLVVYVLLPFAFSDKPFLHTLLLKGCYIYIIATLLRLACSLINSLNDLADRQEKTRNRPLKGVFQMAKILIIFVCIILIFSVLLDKSPTDLFVGLGAAATILMLVFKDTIVGLVSGVQLSANDMLRPGDWITMPKYNADGVVFEVNLTTVKVRNWDNTVTTVPPYTLVSDSFQNWRGMFESGGRRIKRSLCIDMAGVRFCTPQELKRYAKEGLVMEEDKRDELTNLTMLRRALLKYLRSHPRVNQDLMVMVRQLQPTSQGIPLELYFFSANKQWVAYETLQADVFDYVLAIVPTYGLRVFQTPSGEDVKGIKSL